MKRSITSGLFALISLLFFNCATHLEFDNIPAPPNELVVARWSPDHVWIPAHHVYKNGKMVRVRGRYHYRPSYKSKWIPAHIRKTPRGKIWINDRWE